MVFYCYDLFRLPKLILQDKLYKCQQLRKRITDKRNDIYDVRAVVMNGASVRSGNIANRVERVVEMMNDLADFYTRKVEETEESERRITELIDRISDSEERMVLFLHYVEGKTFLEIGDALHLSERTVWNRHSCAIGRLCDSG